MFHIPSLCEIGHVEVWLQDQIHTGHLSRDCEKWKKNKNKPIVFLIGQNIPHC